MTKYFLLLSTLFLIGCSSAFPDHPASWEDFIPVTEVKLEAVPSLSPQDWIAEHFPQECQWEKYKRAVDGDTIVTEYFRVRLIGIDTPETKHPKKPIEKGGLEASAFTKDILKETKQVCLINDSVGDKYDKYGRKLSYVFTEQGDDVNAELLRAGLAKGYFRFPFERKAEFREIEKRAKAQKVGLWE